MCTLKDSIKADINKQLNFLANNCIQSAFNKNPKLLDYFKNDYTLQPFGYLDDINEILSQKSYKYRIFTQYFCTLIKSYLLKIITVELTLMNDLENKNLSSIEDILSLYLWTKHDTSENKSRGNAKAKNCADTFYAEKDSINTEDKNKRIHKRTESIRDPLVAARTTNQRTFNALKRAFQEIIASYTPPAAISNSDNFVEKDDFPLFNNSLFNPSTFTQKDISFLPLSSNDIKKINCPETETYNYPKSLSLYYGFICDMLREGSGDSLFLKTEKYDAAVNPKNNNMNNASNRYNSLVERYEYYFKLTSTLIDSIGNMKSPEYVCNEFLLSRFTNSTFMHSTDSTLYKMISANIEMESLTWDDEPGEHTMDDISILKQSRSLYYLSLLKLMMIFDINMHTLYAILKKSVFLSLKTTEIGDTKYADNYCNIVSTFNFIHALLNDVYKNAGHLIESTISNYTPKPNKAVLYSFSELSSDYATALEIYKDEIEKEKKDEKENTKKIFFKSRNDRMIFSHLIYHSATNGILKNL